MVGYFIYFNRVGFFALGLKSLNVEKRQLRADNGRLHIGRGDELLNSERVEIESEIFEEIAFIRVIAITEDRFAAQLCLVIF